VPKICYRDKRFGSARADMIVTANQIIEDYTAKGFTLTVRQLYYQFVARDLIENTVQSYKRLGDVVNDGRLAGLIDWNAIEDRTRNVQSVSSWDSPSDIIEACAAQYRVDMWARQPYRPEVWVEKEALAGVFWKVCEDQSVPLFCCRGYTSQSEMWGAAMRLRGWSDSGQQTPVILHFGDHDPSGIDMTRDIRDRLELFGMALKVDRLALNMDQVKEHDPPPNPAKLTDSRCMAYIQQYGASSWELDALDPETLARLVTDALDELREPDVWAADADNQKRGRGRLSAVSNRWQDVCNLIDSQPRGV